MTVADAEPDCPTAKGAYVYHMSEGMLTPVGLMLKFTVYRWCAA